MLDKKELKREIEELEENNQEFELILFDDLDNPEEQDRKLLENRFIREDIIAIAKSGRPGMPT